MKPCVMQKMISVCIDVTFPIKKSINAKENRHDKHPDYVVLLHEKYKRCILSILNVVLLTASLNLYYWSSSSSFNASFQHMRASNSDPFKSSQSKAPLRILRRNIALCGLDNCRPVTQSITEFITKTSGMCTVIGIRKQFL